MSFPAIDRKAKRLRIYLGESDQWRGRPLYAALLEQLKKDGMAGATVLRGVAGFGAHSRIHTAAILDLSTDLPLIVEVVDSAEKIVSEMETISGMVREGLITVEDVEVIAYTHRFLRPLPADRHIREVMTANPTAVSQDQLALEAWEMMIGQNLKALPVIDDQRRVVGLITQDDFIERAGLNARLAVARKLDEETLRDEMAVLHNSSLKVREIMSHPAVIVSPDDPIGLAAERMVSRGITRLPVVDSDGKLIGIISRLDLLRQVLDYPEPAHEHAPLRASGRRAGEVMSAVVPVVKEEQGLGEVIASFLASGEHRVVVVDRAEKPVGIITDSDVVEKIQPHMHRGILGALRGKSQPPDLSITAREMMSVGVETVSPETSLVEVIQTMVNAGRKWLVVVDEGGKPIGLIDRETALEALVR